MYEELKKCPFCGGKAAFHKVTVNDNGSVKDMYGVYCIDCRNHSEYCYTIKQAVEDWNSLRKIIMVLKSYYRRKLKK